MKPRKPHDKLDRIIVQGYSYWIVDYRTPKPDELFLRRNKAFETFGDYVKFIVRRPEYVGVTRASEIGDVILSKHARYILRVEPEKPLTNRPLPHRVPLHPRA